MCLTFRLCEPDVAQSVDELFGVVVRWLEGIELHLERKIRLISLPASPTPLLLPTAHFQFYQVVLQSESDEFDVSVTIFHLSFDCLCQRDSLLINVLLNNNTGDHRNQNQNQPTFGENDAVVNDKLAADRLDDAALTGVTASGSRCVVAANDDVNVNLVGDQSRVVDVGDDDGRDDVGVGADVGVSAAVGADVNEGFESGGDVGLREATSPDPVTYEAFLLEGNVVYHCT